MGSKMAEYICPHCKKPNLDDDALRCIYCEELLNRRIGFLSDIRYSHIATIVILILLLSFIVFMSLDSNKRRCFKCFAHIARKR